MDKRLNCALKIYEKMIGYYTRTYNHIIIRIFFLMDWYNDLWNNLDTCQVPKHTKTWLKSGRQSAYRRFARIAANEPEHARFSYARSCRRDRRRRRLSSRQIPRLRLAARPICWILGRRDCIRHERVPHAGCPFPIARRLAGRRDLSRTVFENESV